jgi:two-component system response regulator AtoC
MVLAEGDVLLPEIFSKELDVGDGCDKVDDFFTGFSLKAAQKVFEKRLIVKALNETGGNRTKASRLLEISHPSLLSKIKSYDILL